MKVASNWKDYEILDMANGEKLERWNNIYLVRPDPQIIWNDKQFPEKWKIANARYNRSSTGGGHWDYKKKLPDSWQIKYKNLTFNIKPMGFKHTGIFPEQAVNWDWMMDKIQNFNFSICSFYFTLNFIHHPIPVNSLFWENASMFKSHWLNIKS